jgi:hypothetical protein
MFQFIDVGDASPERKKRNKTLARSHAMKVARKSQREQREKKEREKREREEGEREEREREKTKHDDEGISAESSTLTNSGEATSQNAHSKGLVSAITFIPEYKRSLNELLGPTDPEFSGFVWSLCLDKNISSVALSKSSFVDADLNVLRTFSGRVTPHLHELVDHGMLHKHSL